MTSTTSNVAELATAFLAALDTKSLNLLSDEQLALEASLRGAVSDSELSNTPLHVQTVTVLMADIRGFCSMAESLPPIVTAEMLNRFFVAMSEVVVKQGGQINKLLGDGMMILFGLPQKQGDDIHRALACAVLMQQEMAAINAENEKMGLPPMFMGIGINTGEMVVGRMGSRHHSEFTVVGEHVNIAARIEAHALRGQILLSENTQPLASHYCETGEPKPIFMKGRQESLVLHELLATRWPRLLKVPVREQRREARVEGNFPCQFFTLSNKIVGSEAVAGKVIDISYGGMKILAKANLEVGTEIKLPLNFSLLEQRTTPIFARIVVKDMHPKDGFYYGVAITSADEESQNVIRRFVDDSIESR
jgi:adenylate cyclase